MSEPTPAEVGRALIRQAGKATLATLAAVGGPEPRPYASLVLVACDHDASPILLLSDLAEHSRNIAACDRVSLLIEGAGGAGDPLEGPRLSVEGRIAPSVDARHRARFLARHPSAGVYADFADFVLYRIAVSRGHLVQGFGKIDWIEADALLYDAGTAAALAEAEAGIVEHMNADHADALSAYAVALLGRAPGEWRMTGIDPEGCDLDAGSGRSARVAFDDAVTGPAEARAALVALAKRAREGSKD
jgi:heme iron utilization protein